MANVDQLVFHIAARVSASLKGKAHDEKFVKGFEAEEVK